MKRFLPWLCLFALAGCVWRHNAAYEVRQVNGGLAIAPTNSLALSYADRDGCAVFESAHWILCFEGLSDGQRQTFRFPAKEQTVQIAGEGISGLTITCRRNENLLVFDSYYTGGTNRVKVGAAEVRFVERGRTLLVGDQRIECGAGTTQVHLSKKGRVTTVSH